MTGNAAGMLLPEKDIQKLIRFISILLSAKDGSIFSQVLAMEHLAIQIKISKTS